MTASRFYLCCIGIIIVAAMFASCGGDASSIFNVAGKKAYIRSVSLSLTPNASGGTVTIGPNDYPAPSVYPPDLPGGLGFDKSIINYQVMVQGKPNEAVFTISPDSDAIQVQYVSASVAIDSEYVPNVDSFNGAPTVNFDPVTREGEVRVPVSLEEDSVVALMATSAGMRETIYVIRLQNAHRVNKIVMLSPYSTDEIVRSTYAMFDNARYSPSLNNYRLLFLPQNIQVRAVVNYERCTVQLSDNSGATWTPVPVAYDQTVKVWHATAAFKYTEPIRKEYKLKITSEDGAASRVIDLDLERSVYVYVGEKIQYTTDKYNLGGVDLNGGIKELKQAIWDAGYLNFYTPAAPVKITGVITCVGIQIENMQTRPEDASQLPNSPIGYGPIETQNMCFCIEDAEAGIVVAYDGPTQEPPSVGDMPFQVGDIVEIEITHGRQHFNEPTAIFKKDSQRIIDHTDTFQYIEISNTGLEDAGLANGTQTAYGAAARDYVLPRQGRVVRYTGYILRESTGQSRAPLYLTWYITDGGPPLPPPYNYGPRLYMRSYSYYDEGNTEWYRLFQDEKEHYFYGAAIYSYNIVRIQIMHPGQIHDYP